MLPNLIIIGANKCGTTSLHYYLSLHPQIVMSKEKELEFFVEEGNWAKGVDWYASHFKKTAKIRGESSPRYTNYPYFAGVATRMHEVLPHAKLIYMVRDPIERMISQYIHWYASGIENRTIEEAFDSRDNPYLPRSLYFTQLEQYLPYYPTSRILVLAAEELLKQRRSTLGKVFDFLDVESNFYRHRHAIRRHISARKRRKTELGKRIAETKPGKLLHRIPVRFRWPLEDLIYWPLSHRVERPTVSDFMRQDLAKRLRKDVAELRLFTGYGFEHWSL
jgi:hypothetical protein